MRSRCCSEWGLHGNSVTIFPVSSYLTFPQSPITWHLFSVALSLESPPPGITRHPALWSPDFPHALCARDHLTYFHSILTFLFLFVKNSFTFTIIYIIMYSLVILEGQMKLKTNDITVIALFSAILCIISPITISTGTIPFSLSLFAVILTAISLGTKKGILAVLIYILIGSLGLPVFSGFTGGIQILFGPTGGFILSYIIITIIVSLASKHKKLTLYIFSIFSLAVCYLFGSLQYAFIARVSFHNALLVCVYPFIVFDILKAILAINIGLKLKRII